MQKHVCFLDGDKSFERRAIENALIIQGFFQLSGGDVVELAGVFVALGVAGSTALARKIGAAVENDRIVTDEKMQTTVPGLYAAGDCTGGLLQVAKAVYEGALAGTEAAKALRKG